MTKPAYTLESVSIHRNSWERNAPLRCSVKFKHLAGSVEINLDESASAAVLAVIADQVVAAASMRADDMKAAFVEGAAEAGAALITSDA